MSKKTSSRKKAPERPSPVPPALEPMRETARRLFHPTEREPYYLRDLALRNFDELHEHIGEFTEEQARWVADWVEYLGDPETAKRIRGQTREFRKIIDERHRELARLLGAPE
ncbi:MAG: hypothetical protein HY558_02070 [Euryarchaeota archaeon]|nr:hypothetical protein [Euryarchaeota archaeon]